MDFNLTEQHEQLREEIVRLAQSVSVEIEAFGESSAVTAQTWKACARTGIQGLPLESEYGGRELDSVAMAVALVAFGEGCTNSSLALASARHLLSCVVPIWKFGSQEQKKTILPLLADGNHVAMLVAPQLGGFLTKDQLVVETTQTGFRLSGKVGCVTCTPEPDLLIAIAQDKTASGSEGDSTAFVLQQNISGVTGGPEGASLLFDSVELSESGILGSKGQGGALLKEVDQWQQVYGSAVRVGAMQRLLEQMLASASRYSFSSKLAGCPATSFQSASHRLADFNISVEAARLLLYRAAWRLGVFGDVAADGAVADLFVNDVLHKSTLEALHVQQEYGLLVEPFATQVLQNLLAECGTVGEVGRSRDIVARYIGLASQ